MRIPKDITFAAPEIDGRELPSGIRVLHVGEVVRGGIATYLRAVVPMQRAAFGDEAVLGLYPACYADDMAGIFAAPCLVRWHGRGPISSMRYAFAIARAIRRKRPDLVHAHSTFPGLYVRLAVLSMRPHARPAVVYCAHGWCFRQDVSSLRKRVYTAVERRLAAVTDGIVHISHDEAKAAHGAGITAAEQATIHNGLPDLPQQPVTRRDAGETLTLLFVGRLDRQKGLDILLEALALVTRPNVVLHVAGAAVIQGGNTSVPEQAPNIVSHGWISAGALELLYQQADVVVMPSRWEGFGYVALEAMRAGCAVFASDRGALPELVLDQETGRLFDPSQPKSLARLIEDTDNRTLRLMGRRARAQFLAGFVAEKCGRSLLQFYSRVLSRRAARIVRCSA